MKKQKRSLGLTLLELLVTIAIIGIISSIGYVIYENGQDQARDSKRKNDLRDIQTALQLYYDDNGYYPPSPTSVYNSVSTNPQPWISELDSKYIKNLPVDPKNSHSRRYRYDSPTGHQTYILSADFQSDDPAKINDCNLNDSDQDYCVTNP